jgi:hypothetical protein
MMKLNTLLLAVLASTTLVACGGGDDSGTMPVVQTANSFESSAGTYSSGCMAGFSGSSESFVLVVTPTPGADKASVSFQAKRYNTADCTTSVRTDFTGLGEITPLNQTKAITASKTIVAGKMVDSKSGTVKVVEFKYTGLQLAMGNLAFPLPTAGATAKVGYLIEGNKIYALTGSRAADGLSNDFSSTVLTKQ